MAQGTSQPSTLGIPLHPPGRSVVRMLLLPILALNVADVVYTLGWVGTGLAVEANPLMAHALETGPAAFALTKLSLVALGLLLLDRFRHLELAQASAVAMFLVYLAIFALHLEGTEHLLLPG